MRNYFGGTGGTDEGGGNVVLMVVAVMVVVVVAVGVGKEAIRETALTCYTRRSRKCRIYRVHAPKAATGAVSPPPVARIAMVMRGLSLCE